MFSSTAAATVALAFISQVQAHMVMTNPVPYNFKDLNSSPLGEGIAFPCHKGGNYDPDYSADGATAEAGKPINVKFEGSAVHGGGACQFSVAYLDKGAGPLADRTQWKVIHTIASGCPAEAEANLVTSGTDANQRPTGPQCPPGQESTGKECVRSYNVMLPKDMKNGKAVFAWTWFNKIGNREMYMNCAPIEITGGVDDDTGVSALPSIFAANVPSTFNCATEPGVLGIPQDFVGSSVDGTINFGANEGSCDAATVNGFGGGAGNGGGNGGGNGNTTPPPADSAPAPPQNPGNAFAPSPSPEPAPVNPPTEAPSQPETPAQPPAETAPAPGAAGSVPCTAEGAIVCIGDSQWGLCNHGTAVPQALAAGTVCGSGAISAKAAKRHLHRHLRPHPRSFR